MTTDNAVSSSGYDSPSPSLGPKVTASLIGRGVYSIAEAARLVRVHRDAITRWSRGYSYEWRGERRTAPPVFDSRLTDDARDIFLDFADLMEIRVLAQFRRHGVTWPTIRLCAARVAELRRSSHPFSAEDFRTDGRSILLEVAAETTDPAFLNLVKDQLEFGKLVRPFLKEVDFDGKVPVRWWPTGKRDVMLDPTFAFGAPVVKGSAIRTRVLADGYRAEGSYQAVAWWYNVPLNLVKAAVKFEYALAA